MDSNPIRLTTTVKKGGCAAKLPAGELKKALGSLSLSKPAELHVGTEHLDDACLWNLGNGQYMVQTLDFFTPIVDDPADFGAIAAANSMSDVYAMGGEPKVALTILAYPSATLPMEMLEPLMRGAIQKIQEAGACVAGGHSIDDETLKLGFSVTGFVNIGEEWTNQGARPGDVLILTKGLGTGTLTTALKLGELSAELAQGAIQSMTQLNRVRDLLGKIKVNAATDITGFGLAGHAMQMAKASLCSFELEASRIPSLSGALSLLADGYLNRAHKTNRDYTQAHVRYDGVDEARQNLTLDAQTSGGLFLSVPEASAGEALRALRSRFPASEIIGRAIAPQQDWVLRFRG